MTVMRRSPGVGDREANNKRRGALTPPLTSTAESGLMSPDTAALWAMALGVFDAD
jgi:hypothetical protein